MCVWGGAAEAMLVLAGAFRLLSRLDACRGVPATVTPAPLP